MAPVRMLNLRGGSVSPSNRVYDTSVIKVDGEVFDRDGYRMDVTVWFRHRNEVLYYLDSGGSVHGPMDQKHSTRLGNISRSGQLIPGSRYYLSDSSTRHRTMRRQSDSAAWDIRSEGASRGRTYSESYRPLSNERSHEVTSSRYYNQYTPSTTHYKTTASHHVGAASPPTAHISRWSSMQSYGTHGLWRGSSGNRYATTLTRQHIKKHRDPVEVLVKHAPSVGASKVDLVSIDNRAGVSPQQVVYSPNTYTYSQLETETNTERERRLQDELLSTKRELQALKRSRSLSGEQGGLLPSSTRQKSTSTQYLNQSSWTTHTLMKNDGLPCGARFAATPGRATSQTNIPGYTSLGRPQWTSDLNIRSTTNYKQMPMHSTYSAHRENMQRREEQRRATEAEQRSTRYFDDSKVAGGAEVLEEVETITLQPIGRGVHDLEPTGSVGRSYRAYTPTGSVQSIRSVPIRWSKIQPENLTRFHSQQQETGHRGWAHQMSAQSPKLVHESASADFFNFIGTPVIHSGPFPYSNSAEFQGPLRVDTTSYRPRHQGRQNLSPLGITRSLPRTTGSASPRNCEQRSPKGMVVRRPMFSTLNAHESSSPASRAYTPGPDQSDGYRTIATTNVHREIPTSGGPSPFAGIRQNSLYEGRGSENRYRTSQPLDSHWRATTVPPNYAGSVSGMSASGDASEWEQVLLKQVKNTFREWYMPEKSREDVENLLRDREPGSFIVRNRLSHENSFSLGLKAPGLPDPYRHGSIKHYIINSVPMHDGRGTGLQLSGFSDQPVFPDFVSFVHHHCMHAGPFPCALRLPISFASSQPPSNAYGSINKVKMPAGGGGVVVDMLYLGSVQVDKLETLSAVRKAVTKILGQASTNGKGLSKRSVVTVSAKPNEGVRFSGSTKRGKMDESIKPSDISFCGLDPEGRTFSGEELRARGLTQARMFGIVARSKPIWMHGNLVFVFSELDPNQSALSLISYINQVFVS
ncbi:unnamed protein product [Dicrocoelium dendriticum]|nr:unnamed protein product [Dicrocoelium dendriticum]